MTSIKSKTSITTARLLRKPEIADQLLGLSPPDEGTIQSYEDFLNIFRIRHDLIHSLICDIRGYKFGEERVSEIFKDHEFKDKQYYDLVKNQTPDIMSLEGNVVTVIELSISRSSLMEKQKESKYALLSYFLRRNGFKIFNEYIIINPDAVYQQRDKLIKLHKLNDPTIDKIKEICENCKKLEYGLKSTEKGSLFYLQYYNITDKPTTIDVSIKEAVDLYRLCPNKPFHSETDLIKIFTKPIKPYIETEDEVFLKKAVDLALEIKPSLASNEEFDEISIIKQINDESKRKNGLLQTDLRSIFPLPYMRLINVDSAIRSTEEDLINTTKIAGKIMRCDDPTINFFGTQFLTHSVNIRENRDFPFTVHMSKDMKSIIALEGPNRKHFARRPDLYPEHYARQKEHTMYSLSYETNVSEITPFSFQLSEVDIPKKNEDIYKECESITNLSGFGLHYVKICQSIYREVNINSLRSERRKKFILKPTGIIGVYVLLFKGPKLRTGEVPSQIWFKVIIDNDYISSEMFDVPMWMFKRIKNSITVSHSGWLSVDAHRLDHYIRCYDKIIMTYVTFMNFKFRSTYIYDKDIDPEVNNQKNKSLVESMQNDNTNTLGVIILTYMEDRRSTSKLLQNVRYLVMTMLSIYKFPNSVFEKCIEPMRSPLQLYFLKNMIEFTKRIQNLHMSKQFKYGPIKYDYKSKVFIESMGGCQLLLPRPIITDHDSPFADFTEILCEMYLTMLFNKNQDDPTHASFQILSKMLEGEESMKEVKEKNNHLGYKPKMKNTTWAKHVVENKHNHQFSAKAIEIGAKLNRERVGDKLATDIIVACQKSNVNKSIDEFATYKSSSNIDRLKYNKDEIRQNTRRRCIEATFELFDEKCKDSVDVANKYLSHPVEFQIFKKNQIGGVREILILTLKSRIKINMIETISRNICSFDKRETLTHGDKKNELVKECLYNARRKPGKRMTMFFSLDKSRWGPSFVPIQFLYLFTPFREQLGTFFPYIVTQLILHQNKKCILPEKLISAWASDPSNKLEHRKDYRLQNLKEHFLKTGELYFDNESNMGQGILHYTSSYLHAAMISFRDKIYQMMCDQFGFDHDDHYDLFSSDDSFTAYSLEVHKMSITIKKLDLFMRAQELSERLFNCSTSKSKSSINPLIGEFNSLFMSNLTFFPTLMKFTLASVHPVNTDSFHRMVKESFASSRQIVENGGTLDLYLISHYFNKRYCESIYHTYSGGCNDPKIYNVIERPYQIGYYPIFNPSLMLMFGPEFYNYTLYSKFDKLTKEEQNLFKTSHKIIKGGVVETLAEMEEGDTMLGGLLRIEANMGPVRQYTRIRRVAEQRIMTRDQVEEIIMNDPLILFKPPLDLETVKFRTIHKLMVPGAQEALKTTAASIYYGRVAATVSADAFYIPNHEMPNQTYLKCLEHLIFKESLYENLNENIKFLYPKWPEYEIFLDDAYKPIPFLVRNIMEIQTVRTLSTFKVGTKLNNPIYDIIRFLWMGFSPPDHERNRFLRDTQIIQKFYPMIKSSLEETKDQFTGDEKSKVKSVIMLLLKLYSLRDRTIKAIVYGPSTNDLKETYLVLSERNSSLAHTHLLHTQSVHKPAPNRITYDDIFMRHNYYILATLCGRPELAKTAFEDIDNEVIQHLMTDQSLGPNTKKRLLMPLLVTEKITELEKWSEATSSVMHFWEVRQEFDPIDKIWFGNFCLIIFHGMKKIRIEYNSYKDFYKFSKNDFDDPSLLFDMLSELSGLINQTLDEIIKRTNKGHWKIQGNTVISIPHGDFEINKSITPMIIYNGEYYLDINDSTTTLYQISGKKNVSIMTGLITTSSRESALLSFNCYGLKFSDLVKHGAFTKDFDVTYKTIHTIRDMVKDLHVERPNVSIQTIERLNLQGDWNVRSELKEEEKIIEITKTEEEESNMDFIEWMKDSDKELAEMKDSITWDIDPLSEFIGEFLSTDFFNNVQIVSDIQFPRKTFNIVKNLKYDLICLLTTNMGMVSRSTIQDIYNLLDENRSFILFSLISRYDRIVSDTGEKSPEVVNIKFDNKLFELGVTKKHLESIIEL